MATAVAADTSNSGTTRDIEESWTIYEDPRFNFSLEYPPSYLVEPRDDKIAGSVLTFRQPASISQDRSVGEVEVSAQIVVGMYHVEWTGNESIERWTEKYYDLVGLESSQDRSEKNLVVNVDGNRSVKVTDQSSEGAYQYVNIPRSGIVWFIWSNGKVDTTTFDRVVNSFRFSVDSPETLQNVYGPSFHPFPIGKSKPESSAILRVPSYIRVPLSGNASCNSQAHVNGSQFAIDVAKTIGTAAYASQEGSVFYGWYPNDWGNLLIITTPSWAGSFKIYYAHLNGYNEATLLDPPVFYIYKDEVLAFTGNTGNSDGPHLHFEVRDSGNNGVTLAGMSGFTAGSTYPDGANCGTLVR